MIDLEIIERGTPVDERPSLMFVHGYWQAAWTWDEYVMPALAELGHHAVAMSLRGHGQSGGKIRGSSVRDYVDDVAEVAATLDQPPIVIGHSMGGFTTQHYLAAGHPAAAAILVSPVPSQGAWGATFKAVAKHPWLFLKTNLTLDVGAVVETPAACEDFLGPAAPEYFDQLERASYRTYMDLLLNRPDLSQVSMPVLVVGGTNDAFFTESEWRKTTKQIDGELVMLDGVAHQPMWEGGGTRLIDEIDRFARSV